MSERTCVVAFSVSSVKWTIRSHPRLKYGRRVLPTASRPLSRRAFLLSTTSGAAYDAWAKQYETLDGRTALTDALGLSGARRRLCGLARGDVLEIGVGTGVNLPLYERGRLTSLTGVDASGGMLEEADDAARRVEAKLVRAQVERMPFSDKSFDTILDTFSLCTFEQPLAALRECHRLLRDSKKSRLLLLEHTASEWGPLRAYQDLTASTVGGMSKGCVWNQRVEKMAEEAGFIPIHVERMLGGTIVSMELAARRIRSAPMDLNSVINDDAALRAMLDGLGEVVVDRPRRACDVDADPTAEELEAHLQRANDALRDADDHIPAPSADGRNSGRVLAAALVAVARLGDSARAQRQLREEAEGRVKRLQFEVDDAARAAKEAARAERRRAQKDRDALESMREELTRERRLHQKAQAASTEARSTATAAGNRAQVAEAALRRRDREVAALQKRIHAQLGGARRPNFAVELTGPGGAPGELLRPARGGNLDDSVRQFTQLAVKVERQRCGDLERENVQLREQVDAIQHELDALLHGFPRVVELEQQQQAILNGDMEDADDIVHPIRALDAPRMLLPYDAIAEKVDEALVTKFKMLRRALCYQELVEADLADKLTVLPNAEAADDEVLVEGEQSARGIAEAPADGAQSDREVAEEEQSAEKDDDQVVEEEGAGEADEMRVSEEGDGAADDEKGAEDYAVDAAYDELLHEDEMLSERLSKSTKSLEGAHTQVEDVVLNDLAQNEAVER